MPVPGDVFPSNTRANYFGVAQIIIPDYADTTKTKSLVFHAGMNVNIDTMRYARKGGGLWTGTAAISSITFLPQYTFAAGSTFSLYGAI